jgi:hypothetical protein
LKNNNHFYRILLPLTKKEKHMAQVQVEEEEEGKEQEGKE